MLEITLTQDFKESQCRACNRSKIKWLSYWTRGYERRIRRRPSARDPPSTSSHFHCRTNSRSRKSNHPTQWSPRCHLPESFHYPCRTLSLRMETAEYVCLASIGKK